MIVIRVHGGLGNQMFQYAYGRELAHRGYEVVYEESSYAADALRRYELNVWRVDPPLLSGPEAARLPRRYGGKGMGSWLQGRRPFRKLNERPLGFRPRFLAPARHSYATGYWQSERFFPSVRKELTTAFQPSAPLTSESAAVARRIEQTDAIGIHVRRTDYLQHAFTQVCGVDYYQHCVGRLLANHEGLEAFVFSDDLAWCEANLRLACPTHFVGHNPGERAYEDLWLLSRCRRHVIPNSSFSWWAAWLKPDQDGEVYAPRPWFNDPQLDSGEIVPDRWNSIAAADCLPVRSAA